MGPCPGLRNSGQGTTGRGITGPREPAAQSLDRRARARTTPDPQAQWSPGKATAALFALATLACVAALAATYYFFVRTTTGQFIDESALVEAVAISGTAGKAATKFLDWLPALSLVIAAVVVSSSRSYRRRWAAARDCRGGVRGRQRGHPDPQGPAAAAAVPRRGDAGAELAAVRAHHAGGVGRGGSVPDGLAALAAAGRLSGRQLRGRHRRVHADQPVAPAGRRGGGLPGGGRLHDPGRLADSSATGRVERLGRLRRALGLGHGCGWRCPCCWGWPRPRVAVYSLLKIAPGTARRTAPPTTSGPARR